ncbi:hypothetical protein KXS07_36505 [Inquilinus limosus]|uniref:hypothetical protein n=1 Tax=Inquilinus limosus TaxID=171674 RepID=UPI003F16F37A
MTAAMLVLEPIFEADLPPEQYAYRDDGGLMVQSLSRASILDLKLGASRLLPGRGVGLAHNNHRDHAESDRLFILRYYYKMDFDVILPSFS